MKRFAAVILVSLFPLLAGAQALHIQDQIRTHAGLTNTTITMAGRSELRITGDGDPLPGSVINFESPDAWVLFTALEPSIVASTFLSRIRVHNLPAALDSNVRVVQYAEGAVVIPHAPHFSPLTIFEGRFLTGRTKEVSTYTEYDSQDLASQGIASFILKRGYMATFAQQENGSGISRNYVAQDGDLEVGLLPAALENNIRFIRVFPWRWSGKKGVAGNIESGLDVSWVYNWNLDRNSPLNWEYVPIKQQRWWPSLDQNWENRQATHLLGYNEPDRPDQANLSVSDAIAGWPELLGTGLRVGAPAVSDGGLGWLYDFMSRADAANLRVDYVPVHYYRCYGNASDPNGAATQLYNFLKGIYDVVQRPLWVTEWNNGANWTTCSDPTFTQQQAAISAMINMLDNTSFVERYAIYNWVEDVRRVKWDDGSLTAAGTTYRDQNSPLAYRQEMPDAGTGTSARYSFDGDTHDASSNGQNAMRIGFPAFTAGKYGKAIALNGSTDYLQLSPRIADNSDWSFAGWVFWNGGANWQRIFDFGLDTSHYLFLTPRSGGGTLRFAINNGSGEQQLNAPALPVGTWNHLAVTISGNTGKLFVNGQAVATNNSMTINPSDAQTKFNYLGKSQFAADPLFSGRLDDFRFISSALSDAQIAAIASTPPPQFNNSHLHKPPAVIQQPYSASITQDANGARPLTFSKVAGPAWLSISPQGNLSGTPETANGGVNSFLVRVSDANGSTHTASLLINVTPIVAATINASSDDAEQAASGEVSLNSTDLELVEDPGAGSGSQIIGLRFAGLPLPQGAAITSAAIEFTADEFQTNDTQLKIRVEASDNAPTFEAFSRNLSLRPIAQMEVAWHPASWNAGDASFQQRTPNLAGLVQEIVTRPGWSPGNAITFLILGSGHRTAEAFDKEGGTPPRLVVSYDSPAPLIASTSIINSSQNDAEESAAGAINLTSTDLELVNDGGAGNQTIGLRFEGVTIPAGAIIESANIQFTSDEITTDSAMLSIQADAADDSPVFAAALNSLSNRPRTTNEIEWIPGPWMHPSEKGPLQRSPDISMLIEEIISRPGWSTGNAISFLITGTGRRRANSADLAGGSPAELNITYYSEVPPGTYAAWAGTNTLALNLMDNPDGDGYKNLLEYALDLNPLAQESNITPLEVAAQWLELAYSRPSSIIDLIYTVEWANTVDSGSWTSSGVMQQIVSDDGTRRIMRARISKGFGDKKYVRLKVSLR